MEKQLRKNILFNTAGSLVFYVCQAAVNLLVVALAGIEAGGVLGVAMTAANVCVSFASYGMRTFQVSDLAHSYADATYLHSRYITLAAAMLGCLCFAFLNPYSAEQRWVILLFTGYRLVESWSDVWHGYLQRGERMDLVGISFGVRGLVTALCVILGLWLTGSLVFTAGVLFLANALYVLAVDIPLARRQARLDPNAKQTGGSVWALLAECLPLAVYASLNTAIGSVPRYYCERLLGEGALGCFNSVFVPVLVLQVGAVYLFVPFITRFSRLWSGRDRAGFLTALRRLFGCLALLWAAGAAGVALLGRWGLGLLYPTRPEVWAWAGLLQPLVLCCVLTVLATALCNLLIIARGMRGLILGNLAGLAAALVLSPLLIGRFDLYGAAYGTMAGLFVQGACLLISLLRHCQKQFAAG